MRDLSQIVSERTVRIGAVLVGVVLGIAQGLALPKFAARFMPGAPEATYLTMLTTNCLIVFILPWIAVVIGTPLRILFRPAEPSLTGPGAYFLVSGLASLATVGMFLALRGNSSLSCISGLFLSASLAFMVAAVIEKRFVRRGSAQEEEPDC